jgi:hypothetical protein
MKPFALFLGAVDQLGNYNITAEPEYKLVVDAVNQLREQLLSEPVLRAPFLHLLTSVYNELDPFPEDLKNKTLDQVPNITKIRDRPPSDQDVINFLQDSFPELHLVIGDLGPDEIREGETWGGQREAEREKISANLRLVQLWLRAASTSVFPTCSSTEFPLQTNDPATTVSANKLWFMFITVFLRELAHDSLVWYGKAICKSPQLGGVGRDAGEFMEKAVFGGVSAAEFQMKPSIQLVEIGLERSHLFYPISEASFSMAAFGTKTVTR